VWPPSGMPNGQWRARFASICSQLCLAGEHLPLLETCCVLLMLCRFEAAGRLGVGVRLRLVSAQLRDLDNNNFDLGQNLGNNLEQCDHFGGSNFTQIWPPPPAWQQMKCLEASLRAAVCGPPQCMSMGESGAHCVRPHHLLCRSGRPASPASPSERGHHRQRRAWRPRHRPERTWRTSSTRLLANITQETSANWSPSCPVAERAASRGSERRPVCCGQRVLSPATD